MGKEHRAPFKDIAKAYERIGMAHWKQKDYASAIEFIERAQAESSSDSRHKKLKKLAKIKAKSDALAC